MTTSAPSIGASAAAPLNVEEAVRDRYSAASKEAEAALCCPVDYDAAYLKVLPEEILERDYGCGDPSKWVAEGETVLDLGSGGGKICYIASQVVGPGGRVIGVDCNDDMLSLARTHQSDVAAKIGHDNVTFFKGRIQDLALDLDRFGGVLGQQPVVDAAGWLGALEEADRLRKAAPMVADESVDVVVSNCVLNLVAESDRRQLFSELARVLKVGGRAVISDIVSDRDVPQELKDDADLWSGCISGAYREDAFLAAFEEAGFYGIEVVSRQAEPWQVVEGIAFRSVTVRAYKPDPRATDAEAGHHAVYNGPWAFVMDEAGNQFPRGEAVPVTTAQFERLARPPYADRVTLMQESNAPEPTQPTPSAKQPSLDIVGGCCGDSGCC